MLLIGGAKVVKTMSDVVDDEYPTELAGRECGLASDDFF